MRLVFFALLALSACAPPPTQQAVYTPRQPEAVDSRGIPVDYVKCVRAKARTTPALYDVYDACKYMLISYVSMLDGMTQEQKAQFFVGLDRRGLNFAHEAVIAVHGSSARF